MQEDERGLGTRDLVGLELDAADLHTASALPPYRAQAAAQPVHDPLRVLGRPQRRGPRALLQDQGLVVVEIRQAARAEADVPALVAQDELDPVPQPGQSVVEEIEQRQLTGGEDHALQDHVVEPDGLARRAAHPPPAGAPRRARGTPARQQRARVVEPHRGRVAGEEPRVALLVALLRLEARGGRTVDERGEVLGDARLADAEARDELGQPRAGDLRPGLRVGAQVDRRLVPLGTSGDAQEVLVAREHAPRP